MTEFIAFEPGVEVNGETVLSVVDGLGAFKIMGRAILNSKGITNPAAGGWYPQQAWLDAFKEIMAKVGRTTLEAIGKQIPDHAQWPPQIQTIEDALASIDIAYHINHRKNGKGLFDPGTGTMTEGIGHYAYQKTGERQGTMRCTNPYPCNFDLGIIEAVADKFKPAGSSITIAHDPGGCRINGDDTCTYLISW